jgi:hypothetical protein
VPPDGAFQRPITQNPFKRSCYVGKHGGKPQRGDHSATGLCGEVASQQLSEVFVMACQFRRLTS